MKLCTAASYPGAKLPAKFIGLLPFLLRFLVSLSPQKRPLAVNVWECAPGRAFYGRVAAYACAAELVFPERRECEGFAFAPKCQSPVIPNNKGLRTTAQTSHSPAWCGSVLSHTTNLGVQVSAQSACCTRARLVESFDAYNFQYLFWLIYSLSLNWKLRRE